VHDATVQTRAPGVPPQPAVALGSVQTFVQLPQWFAVLSAVSQSV
jgi:hypothetical protein